jgi:hypothetical protein
MDMKTLILLSVILASVVCLSGCGGDQNLAVVYGKVTLNGEPLPKAFLTFIPQGGKGSPSYGKTDEAGRYEMQFSDSASGAWIGKNLVQISTADAINPEKTIPERVPPAYNKTSDLYRTVEQGKNQFDFELKSDGIVEERPYEG